MTLEHTTLESSARLLQNRKFYPFDDPTDPAHTAAMPKPLILLSIPALREKDVAVMPRLRALMAGGGIATLTPSFPCVTCPVQTNMTTGKRPSEHGVVANGFYWREKRQVEMWTAPNDCIERPQIWDLLSHHGRGLTSAVWFPMHSKGCEADFVCTPAPIHNPDGSESLWCYTRPTELYGELRDRAGPFPADALLGTDGQREGDRVDRRLGGVRRARSGSPISSISICRTSITPPSGPGPTAPRPTRPLPNWTR